MKRCMLLLTLLVSASTITIAMEKNTLERLEQAVSNEESALDVVRKYFNVKGFLFRLGAILSDERNDEDASEGQENQVSDTVLKDIINAYIDALKIGRLPISLGEGQQAEEKTVDTYFDAPKLKELLKKTNNDYFDTTRDAKKAALLEEITQLTTQIENLNKAAEQVKETTAHKDTLARAQKSLKKAQKKLLKLGAYSTIEALRGCLKVDALQRDMKSLEFLEIDKTFEALLEYYKGNPSIDECIYLDRLPALFGYRLEDYCDVIALKRLINHLLKKQPVTAPMLIECFKFQPLLRSLGFKEAKIEEFNLAFHGLMYLVIDFIRNKERAMDRIMRCLAQVAREEQGPQLELKEIEKKELKK